MFLFCLLLSLILANSLRCIVYLNFFISIVTVGAAQTTRIYIYFFQFIFGLTLRRSRVISERVGSNAALVTIRDRDAVRTSPPPPPFGSDAIPERGLTRHRFLPPRFRPTGDLCSFYLSRRIPKYVKSMIK